MKELKTYLIEFNDQSSLEATGNLYLFTDRSAALPLKRDDLIYLNANRVQSIIEVNKKKDTSTYTKEELIQLLKESPDFTVFYTDEQEYQIISNKVNNDNKGDEAALTSEKLIQTVNYFINTENN